MHNPAAQHWRISTVSVAMNTVAAGLLAPVLAAAAFCLVVQTVSMGRLFTVLAAVGSVLPEDARVGAACLFALRAGSLGVLALACARLAWLFPLLLVSLEALAETLVLAIAGLDNLGDTWVLAPGVAGMMLGAMQLRRAVRA